MKKHLLFSILTLLAWSCGSDFQDYSDPNYNSNTAMYGELYGRWELVSITASTQAGVTGSVPFTSGFWEFSGKYTLRANISRGGEGVDEYRYFRVSPINPYGNDAPTIYVFSRMEGEDWYDLYNTGYTITGGTLQTENLALSRGSGFTDFILGSEVVVEGDPGDCDRYFTHYSMTFRRAE